MKRKSGLLLTRSVVLFLIFLLGFGSSALAANYEYTGYITNDTGGPLKFLWYSKGTDDNPRGLGAQTGHLYHGEMLELPEDISAGEQISFKAKSVGSTIQGTLVFEMANSELVWIYFHVPDINRRHSQSRNIEISIQNSGNHSVAQYRIRPSTNRVTFLSYNTHLFKESLVGDFSSSHVWDDSKRREAIVQSIWDLDPDVVALQEVWGNSMKDWFINQLKTTYPYHYAPHAMQTLKISNGLVLLSKFRLENTGNHLFSTLNGTAQNDLTKYLDVFTVGDDWWSEKGYLTANIIFFETLGLSFKSRIGVSHTSTQVELADFSNIGEFVNGTLDGSSHWRLVSVPTNPPIQIAVEWGHDEPFDGATPAFLMGDLNTHISHYDAMNDVFESRNAYDVWEELNGEVTYTNVEFEKAYTVYDAENSLVQIYDPKSNGPDRIDYVYLKQGDNSDVINVEPKSIQVDQTHFKYGDSLVDQSDHWPLVATFELNVEASAAPAKIIEYSYSNTADHNWKKISFGDTVEIEPEAALYRNLVVFSAMQTYEGIDTAGLRIKSLDETGFNVMVEEEISLDEETTHNDETIGYLALLEGKILNNRGVQVGEAGRLQGDHEWRTFTGLTKNYVNPVLVAMMNSTKGLEPAHIRLRNVNANSFEYKVEEWDYLDGVHHMEDISFIVLEAGVHNLDHGVTLQAKTKSMKLSFNEVNFDAPFQQPPVVFSQSQTLNGKDPVVTRQMDISYQGLQVKLQEEENKNQDHNRENVGIIAVGGTYSSITR
ncbi:hypothetical protein BTA51_12680 [Hahella sp. CCB-MM4]|uniref:endonuclease/exonuclease/phosphatase family protein n=1 Tax=Hahella sp. (strain CCB-MM4) TaxID=1926491 RepID=UPI000B9AB4C9|nr:endonuclease/exonuclease/phosphatase family protein [Hahella sp. CCB-MM4]OZG72828.1 hypothetical protein BTA51_12680 [Hahella sp. CCB-MM4]